MSTTVETFADSDGLVSAAGERLISVVDAAVAARGRALIVLTGGGNGNRLLRYLGAQAERIDWASVHLFWGDERYVTEDDDERNDKQARDALLDHVDIPARNVHAMPASDGEFGSDLAAAALAYEQLLAANAGHPRHPRDNSVGGRCRGFAEASAATNYLDAAGNPAVSRGLAAGLGCGESRGGRRRYRWCRPDIGAGGRRSRS
jgi:hypothetical protein